MKTVQDTSTRYGKDSSGRRACWRRQVHFRRTTAKAICSARCLILDSWFVRLYSPDRPAEGLMKWYIERKERCMAQIWATAQDVLDVVLELGLVERASRERFFSLVQEAGYELTIYVLDAPRDVRRERVRKRNLKKGATSAMDVPEAFFEMASDHWEPIDEIERETYDVRVIA